MKTVSTNNLPSRAQCRPDDTSGFMSVELDAVTTDKARYFRHNRGNILHRAIRALFGPANTITCKDLRELHAKGMNLRLALPEDIQ